MLKPLVPTGICRFLALLLMRSAIITGLSVLTPSPMASTTIRGEYPANGAYGYACYSPLILRRYGTGTSPPPHGLYAAKLLTSGSNPRAVLSTSSLIFPLTGVCTMSIRLFPTEEPLEN